MSLNYQITLSFNISKLIEHEDLVNLFESRKEIFIDRLAITANAGEAYKIPTILHYVWLTSSASSREISQNDINNIIQNDALFKSSNQQWQSIIHTNDKSLIPDSVRILEQEGIQVIDLKETIDDEIFFTTMENLITKKHWGLGSDYARYKILQRDGGVYADANFQATRTIDSEMKTYDFFAQDCINYFFATIPHHPILEGLVKKAEENLNNPPEYIREIDSSDIFTKTVVTTLLPFCMSYLKHAHEGNNQDIIFPSSNGYFLIEEGKEFPEVDSYWSITRLNNAFGHLNEYDFIGIDGADGSHITWIEES